MAIEGVLKRPSSKTTAVESPPIHPTPETVEECAVSLPVAVDADPPETAEWIESMRAVVLRHGNDRARFLLKALEREAFSTGVPGHASVTTPT